MASPFTLPPSTYPTTHTCMHAHRSAHTHMHACTDQLTHTCMHTHTHTHTQISTHAHAHYTHSPHSPSPHFPLYVCLNPTPPPPLSARCPPSPLRQRPAVLVELHALLGQACLQLGGQVRQVGQRLVSHALGWGGQTQTPNRARQQSQGGRRHHQHHLRRIGKKCHTDNIRPVRETIKEKEWGY